jgi:hypothetical protein
VPKISEKPISSKKCLFFAIYKVLYREWRFHNRFLYSGVAKTEEKTD